MNNCTHEEVETLLKEKLLKYSTHCFISNTGLTVAQPVHTTKPSNGCVHICVPIDAQYIASSVITETSNYNDEMLDHWVRDIDCMLTPWDAYIDSLIQSGKASDIILGNRVPVVTVAYTAEDVIDAYTSFIATILWTDSSNLKFKGVGSTKKINEFRDVEYIVYEVSKKFYDHRLKYPGHDSSDDYRKCSLDTEQALFNAMHMKVLPLLNETSLEEVLGDRFIKWIVRHNILIKLDKEELNPEDIVLHYKDTVPEEVLSNPYDWHIRTPVNLY